MMENVARQAAEHVPALHLFGDSHCSAYVIVPSVRTHYLGPVTMHRVGRDGLEAFGPGLDDVLNGDAIGAVFGEIDVRVHVGRRSVRWWRSAERVLDDLARRYLRTLSALQLRYDRSRITIFSCVPPSGRDYPSFDPFYPRTGTDAERSAWARGLNGRLREAAAMKGFGFVDQFTPFATPDGLLDLSASDDGVHVRAALLAEVDLRPAFGA